MQVLDVDTLRQHHIWGIKRTQRRHRMGLGRTPKQNICFQTILPLLKWAVEEKKMESFFRTIKPIPLLILSVNERHCLPFRCFRVDGLTFDQILIAVSFEARVS